MRVIALEFSGVPLETEQIEDALKGANFEVIRLAPKDVDGLGQSRFDCIVQFGLGEPPEPGIEFLEKLRRYFPDAPLMVISGHGTEAVQEKVRAIGARFHQRPIHLQSFVHEMRIFGKSGKTKK